MKTALRILSQGGKSEDSAKRICRALKSRLEGRGAKKNLGLEGAVSSLQGNLIRGKAIHPVKTFHPEEWPNVRIYLEDELRKAAGSLVGAPLLLDHSQPLDGRVLEASYVDGAVEYLAELNDEEVLRLIKEGVIRHCSVEYEWDSLERVDGVAPRGITFTGLALLKDFEPGDPETSVEIWRAIAEDLKEAKEQPIGKTVNEAFKFEEAFETLSSRLTEVAEKTEMQYQTLKRQIDRLQAIINEGKPLGEGVIDPSSNFDRNLVSRDEILAELRKVCYERVPRHWSYGAYLQNRRLKDIIKRLELGELCPKTGEK